MSERSPMPNCQDTRKTHADYRLQQTRLRPVHTATTRALDRQGIDYTIVDVSEDADAFALVQDLGYRQVPVVVAGEQHWAGFRPDMISAL
ncbi:glutaredoxin [Sinorhizobium fredii]